MPLIAKLRIVIWLLAGAACGLLAALGADVFLASDSAAVPRDAVTPARVALVLGVLALVLTALLLRGVRQSLARLVSEAAALGQGAITALTETGAPDVAVVARSANALLSRLRAVLDEELTQFGHLLRLTHHDPLTGLASRDHFLARMRALLDREDIPGDALLVICRLPDLQRLNREHGWAVVDILIRRFARGVVTLPLPVQERVAGRLNGSELGLLFVPGLPDDALVALNDLFNQIVRELELPPDCALGVAGTRCRGDEPTAAILTRADAAMAQLVNGSRARPFIVTHGLDTHDEDSALAAIVRKSLSNGDVSDQLHVVGTPVLTAAATLLHVEYRLRLRGEVETPWATVRGALSLLEPAERAALDRLLLERALRHADAAGEPVCVQLSAASLSDGALDACLEVIGSVPLRASRLWIEVPESALAQQGTGFRTLCERARLLGCRVGISHYGTQTHRPGQFTEERFDYLKIDAALVAGVHQRAGNQILLRALLTLAHAAGVLAVGQGASEEAERATLFELGFDGVSSSNASRGASVLAR